MTDFSLNVHPNEIWCTNMTKKPYIILAVSSTYYGDNVKTLAHTKVTLRSVLATDFEEEDLEISYSELNTKFWLHTPAEESAATLRAIKMPINPIVVDMLIPPADLVLEAYESDWDLA